MRQIAVVTIFLFIGFLTACGDDGTLSIDADGPIDIPEEVTSTPGNDVEETTDQTDPSANNPPSNNPSTNNSVEEPTCPVGLSECSGACVDLSQSDDHCGMCGTSCSAETACTNGECLCTDGGDLCGGSCVDTATDPQHCGACDDPCTGGMACVGGTCMALTEVEGVLAATNAARAEGQDCGQYGVLEPAPPLQGDPHLNEAAQAHAVDMVENNFFSHTGSDGSSFSQRVRRTDYSGFPVGENIAGGGSEAAGVVQRWIDSDGHCRNLMNPQATDLGVGFAAGGPYGTMWVQVFGR